MAWPGGSCGLAAQCSENSVADLDPVGAEKGLVESPAT